MKLIDIYAYAYGCIHEWLDCGKFDGLLILALAYLIVKVLSWMVWLMRF